MPPVSTWVVKLGGSLLGAEELRAWLGACAESDPMRCVVVAGGGGLADEVRALQDSWGFDDVLAHALAIEAMALNARVLHAIEPRLPLVGADRDGRLRAQGSCVWCPGPAVARRVRPASWSVSADSIALWLAQRLRAAGVVLVKSLTASELAARAAGQTALTLAAAGIVDADLPRRLLRSPVPLRLHGRDDVAAFAAACRAGIAGGVAVDARAPGR